MRNKGTEKNDLRHLAYFFHIINELLLSSVSWTRLNIYLIKNDSKLGHKI